MYRSMRALILQVAVLLLAAPLLASADVDCSKLDDEDARKECLERKVDRKTDDANVDCSKLDDEDAREECRERKVDRKTDDVDVDDVDCSKLDNDDARRRCRRAKIKN